MQITHDVDAWLQAGGDRRVLDVLRRVGRVQTFTDGQARAFAAVHPDRPERGTVADVSGGGAPLRAAEAWLATEGATEVVGPMHLSPWFPHRVQRPGDASGLPRLRYEPPPPTLDWEAHGYAVDISFVALRCAHGPQIDAGTGAAARLALRGYQLRAWGDDGHAPDHEAFEAAVRRVHALTALEPGVGRGALPAPVDAVIDWYAPLRPYIDPRLVFFVEAPDGATVGFLLGLPETAVPDRRWFQIVALTVAPGHDARGVGGWMVAAAHRSARRLGYSAGVHGPMPVRDGRPEANTALHGDVVRRYALYRKVL